MAAEVTEECYDDVWYEKDVNQTGFITWHQVKDFIARIEVHEVELAEERRILEEERQRRLEEKKKRLEEEEARRAEEERLAQEEGMGDD